MSIQYSSMFYYNGGDWDETAKTSFRPGYVLYPKMPRYFGFDKGPTDKIVHFAAMQPGGIVTWAEADSIYQSCSKSAQKRRNKQYHMNMSHIFRKFFKKIKDSDGIHLRGYYMLDPFLFDYLRGRIERTVMSFE